MRLFKQQIDRWAIRAAAKSLPRIAPRHDQAPEVHALLSSPGLFTPYEKTPDVTLRPDFSFEFPSFVTTPFPKNNLVHGKLFPAGPDWRHQPSVILLHGWNAEAHYLRGIPKLGRQLQDRGLNAVALELPYHLQRRPVQGEAISNFISEDIPRMLEATRQAVADLNALIHWLKSLGSPKVGTWGFSLGGWLIGLHLSESAAQDAALLMTPVSNLERAIAELDFCHPIRAALQVAPADLTSLNLSSRVPKIRPIQLVEGKYDLFVPSETYAELSRSWGLETWGVVRESHISILFSKKASREAITWLERALGPSEMCG